MVDHARTCVINDDEFYTYHSAADGVHLLFNSVYKLVGAAFDGESYQQIGQIPCGRKVFDFDNMKLISSQNSHLEIEQLISSATATGGGCKKAGIQKC